MDKLKAILIRKPTVFVVIASIYAVITAFLRWFPPVFPDIILYCAGVIIGIFFLDVAEEFFQLTPSPFRSIVFCAAFALVSLFIVTSSGSAIASGLVLSLYLTLVLAQIAEWSVRKNLDSWYMMVNARVTEKTQLFILIVYGVLFVFETVIFLQS